MTSPYDTPRPPWWTNWHQRQAEKVVAALLRDPAVAAIIQRGGSIQLPDDPYPTETWRFSGPYVVDMTDEVARMVEGPIFRFSLRYRFGPGFSLPRNPRIVPEAPRYRR